MAAMVYMETWPLGYKPFGLESRYYQRVNHDHVTNSVVYIRVDTYLDGREVVHTAHVTIVKGKMMCGDYTGVHIRNEGTIRWFSNMKVFDNPIFKWVPVDDPCDKVKRLATDDNHVMIVTPPTTKQATNNCAVSFELSKAEDEWPALTA
jgi:hypothetical protein